MLWNYLLHLKDEDAEYYNQRVAGSSPAGSTKRSLFKTHCISKAHGHGYEPFLLIALTFY